jgi:hypothetical protein
MFVKRERPQRAEAVDVRFETNDLWEVAPERARTLEGLIREVVSGAAAGGPVRCHLVRDLQDPERARLRLEAPGWQSSGGVFLKVTSNAREAIARLVPAGLGRRGPSVRLAREWAAIGLPARS